MEMPKVGENHARLAKALGGSWVGDETMYPSGWDPQGGKAKGTMEMKPIADGFYVAGDYTQEREGKISYRAHGVFGWDGKVESYTMYWFDSIGMDPGVPARGQWDGDTLWFETSHAFGNSRYSYQFMDERTYVFRIQESVDKKSWKTVLEGRWTKR